MVEAEKTSIFIGPKELEVAERSVRIGKLQFYDENPRIYSLLQANDLNQDEIEEKMRSFDHVKQLVQSISQVGLMDSILVRGSDYSVLEGNSRLAAYRILSERDPVKYGKIRAKIIVDPISDQDVDTLLGQYHIVGRKDWEPYEQGSFLWRQVNRGRAVKDVAMDYGMTESEVKRLIRNYSFMWEHEISDTKTWSYWDEYLSKKSIKKVRSDEEQRIEFDDLVIRQVTNGTISSAQDIRKLADLASLEGDKRRGKIFWDYFDEELSFAAAVEQFESGADAASIIRKCDKFREFITDADTQDGIAMMNRQERGQLDFSIKKIGIRIEQLRS